MSSSQLILLRHGKSVWNEQNRFTGWEDVPLSAAGEKEAIDAAAACLASEISFDIAYTSYLRRAIQTLWTVLDKMDLLWLPQRADWRFNERHYGALQGLNKAETAAQYGSEQVHRWRRAYRESPPPLTVPKPPADTRYAGVAIPQGESLHDVELRVSAAFDEHIVPALRCRQRVLLVAHGNALRALIKRLENLDDNDIANVEVPTAKPLAYDLDDSLNPLCKRWIEKSDITDDEVAGAE